MKMKTMAQFLIPGDIILLNRKKYEVISSKTAGETTRILYKTKKTKTIRLGTSVKNEWFTVISPIKLND